MVWGKVTSVPDLGFDLRFVFELGDFVGEFNTDCGAYVIVSALHVSIKRVELLSKFYPHLNKKLDFPTPASPVRITNINSKHLNNSYFYRNGHSVHCHWLAFCNASSRVYRIVP